MTDSPRIMLIIGISRGAYGALVAALQRSIHGGAGDAEQVADFAGGVLAGVDQFDQVRLLPRTELGLLTA